MVRTHDIDGTQGDGRGIIYNLVPKYFDTDDEVDLNDPSSYDFEELDKVIDNILATGSEVYFRLVPARMMTISSRRRNRGVDTVLTGSDYYGRAYRNALRFGWDDGYYNTLDYFEIWNEPDLQDFWPNTANQ